MSAARLLLALLFSVGLLGALTSGDVLYSRFIYASALLGFVSWAWTRWAAAGLELKREARSLRAYVGEVFQERYEIVNSSRVPAVWVEILNQSPLPFAAGSRLLTFVTGRQKYTYVARTWLTCRGGFPLGPTRISTGDPFGLFKMEKTIPPRARLIVLPLIYEIRSFPFPSGVLPGGQVIHRKSHDITPHASGVREYVHGDALKRIHWLTTARRSRLMVKEFEQDPQTEVWLYLDAQAKAHYQKPYQTEELEVDAMIFARRPAFKLPPSTLEYAVSITATLAHFFIAQRRAVGYASAGQTLTIHAAERSERQEAKILETLAFVEANGTWSIAELVGAHASQLPRGSTVILVTPTAHADLLHAVDDLQLRRLRPMVVLIRADTFGGAGGAEKLVAALRARRVPLCVIEYEADLSQALAEIPWNFKLQDVQSWRTPAFSP